MAIVLEVAMAARCRPEDVWEKFQDLHAWPWWNQAIAQARWISGRPWEQGSRIELELLRPRHIKLQSEIVEVAVPTMVHWRTRLWGARGQQWFWFESQADGNTLLRARQELSGLATLFLKREDGQRALEIWLGALKTEAEKVARERASYS